MEKNNSWWILLLLLLIPGGLILSSLGLFSITGNESLVRSFPSIVDPGQTFTVTYTASSVSGNWGASVVDELSCKDNLGTIILGNGMSQKFVMISDAGTTATKTFSVPNQMGLICTFTGTYQFGNFSVENFPTQTTQTRGKVCVSGTDTTSDGVVDRTELGVVINGWVANTVTRDKLGQAIIDWSNGC